jgi:hypothetical protein
VTPADTPDLRTALASNPDTPDATLARLCGVSRARVGQVRRAMGLPAPPRSGRGKGPQTVIRWSAEEEQLVSAAAGGKARIAAWLRPIALAAARKERP